MPAKSREQKIRAQERRLHRLGTNFAKEVDTIAQEQVKTVSYSLPSVAPSVAKEIRVKQQHATQADAVYVKKDIIRIGVLTIVIIVLEFALYWLLSVQKLSF